MSNKQTYGSFDMTPKGPFLAGENTTVTLRFTVGDTPITALGSVKFGLPNAGWGKPLLPYHRSDPELEEEPPQICRYKRCNTTCHVTSSSPVTYRTYARESQNFIGPYTNWSFWITITILSGRLQKGDQIMVTYGDPSFGEKGIRVQPWVEKERVWFTAFTDPDGSSRYRQADHSPITVVVEPGPWSETRVTVPSVANPSEPIDIRYALTDWGNNPIDEFQYHKINQIDVLQNDKVIRRITPVESPAGRIDQVKVEEGTPISLAVHTKDSKKVGYSNPSIAKTDDFVAWGDLHTHSFYHQYDEKLGYGHPCTSPSELLDYAKNVAHLDFIALTDGRGALMDNPGWQPAQQAVIDAYEPGRFVTLKGWEIQMGTDGHRNAIYADAGIEPNIDAPLFSHSGIWNKTGDVGMKDVLQYFRGRTDMMLIPHHTMTWMNWDQFDESLDRLVEIYSCWGSSEHLYNEYWDKASFKGQSVVEALNRGYKLGFTGGSDSHTGYVARKPADADRYSFCRYRAGLTGLYTDSLDRACVYRALYERRCYATTGARIIVLFDVDGLPMGSVAPKRHTHPNHLIHCRVVGTDRIRTVEVIKDGCVKFCHTPYENCVEKEWKDSISNDNKTHYYYLRVTQTDGHRAWSSPVWI